MSTRSILDAFRLDGQVAVVTGASRGLGASIAVGLAQAGADVALLARGDCETAAAQIRAAGRKVIAINVDLGKIINIASMLSFQGGIRVVAYTAAKSALLGVTRALANELAAKNINVNAIAPGYMATDNTTALRADVARNKAILDRIPAGRWGEPDDLVGAAVFLASPAAGYVTGSVLPVDGGWLAR